MNTHSWFAIAGLKRMEMQDCATAVLDWDEMLPAVAQGAIGIQCRSDDERSLKYIDALNCMDTHVCVNCERAFLEALDGNCKTPIAGQARIVDGKIVFRGLIAMPDGSEKYTTESTGAIEDAVEIEVVFKMTACHLRTHDFFHALGDIVDVYVVP